MKYALVILAVIGSPAFASQHCNTHDKVMGYLADKYGEKRLMVGIDTNGNMVEILASEAAGSWTITVTTPDMNTCLMGSGEAFTMVDDVEGDPA